MWVKICAHTNIADAQLAAELGADAVGFVFAPSKRQVTPEQVAVIVPELPGGTEKVGVFDSDDATAIASAVHTAGLTAVQLHSGYRPELVRMLNEAFEARVKLIQVVKVPVEGSVEAAMSELTAALRDPGVYAVLLDAAQQGASGGLGVAFPWDAIREPLRAARRSAADQAVRAGTDGPKLLLAGGLHAGNVREAIRTLEPDGVDVASGVEERPGTKSPEKLGAFLEAVRSVSRPKETQGL